VPIVRRVGGLADTVRDAGGGGMLSPDGNGFVFEPAQAHALHEAIARAIDVFHRPAAWAQLMRRGMAEDLSWDGPARQYLALYERAVGTRRAGDFRDTD